MSELFFVFIVSGYIIPHLSQLVKWFWEIFCNFIELFLVFVGELGFYGKLWGHYGNGKEQKAPCHVVTYPCAS